MAQQAAQKRGFGCLGYGCFIAVLIIALTIGGLFWLARSAMRNAVENFTTEQPAAVPTIALVEGARAGFSSKVEEFKRVMADPRASGEFTFSQYDLNAALGDTPFNGKAFVEFQGDVMASTFSFPLRALGEWEAARWIIADYLDRYVTGSARAKLSVTDGIATVTFDELVLNGQVFDGDARKEASEWVSGFVNSQGGSADAQRQRSRIQSAGIRDGVVAVRIRAE
jgi:hypothetical protein